MKDYMQMGNEIIPATVDGTRHNLDQPDLNAAGSAESRMAAANFASGNTPVDGPNAREISNVVASGVHADDHDPGGLSAMMYVWGQFIDHDIDRTPQDGVNHIDIKVPASDPDVAGTIPLTRFTTDPNTGTATNVVTGWIDGSQVYGSDAKTAAGLRLPDGHMASSAGNNLPTVNGAFAGGDVRVAENPDLTAIDTLFVREHNFQVDRLMEAHPDWTGDELYLRARVIVTAEMQNITYQEFLPHLLGKDTIPTYQGYNPTADPRITQEFSTSAFRFGHSIVSGEETKIDNMGNAIAAEDLSDAFFATPDSVAANGGVDALVRNFGSDVTQANDVYAIDALRNLLVAPPAFIDLIAIDVQRERDLGIGSLNQTREALGQMPYTEFKQITSDPVVAANLEKAFGTVDKIDLFIGGLAEDHVDGAMVGSTFKVILQQQFQNLRDGDRLWWQNQGFDDATMKTIENTTLSDIVQRNTDTGYMQPDMFTAQERHPSNVAPEDPDGAQLVMGVNDDGANIAGGEADDTIVTGRGQNQTLSGGGGDDTFVFLNSDQTTTISDFSPEHDTIDLTMASGDFAMSSCNGNTVIDYGGNKINLMGVTQDQITRSDILITDR